MAEYVGIGYKTSTEKKKTRIQLNDSIRVKKKRAAEIDRLKVKVKTQRQPT